MDKSCQKGNVQHCTREQQHKDSLYEGVYEDLPTPLLPHGERLVFSACGRTGWSSALFEVKVAILVELMPATPHATYTGRLWHWPCIEWHDVVAQLTRLRFLFFTLFWQVVYAYDANATTHSEAELPWYEPLCGSFLSISGFRQTRVGRVCTHALVCSLEVLRIAPKGSAQVGITCVSRRILRSRWFAIAGVLGHLTGVYSKI